MNLDDQSLRKSSYKLKISFDKNYNLLSNLKTKNTKVVDEVQTTSLIGSDIKDVKIDLLVEDNFKTFVSKKNQIETDIFKISSPSEAKVRVNRVINFIMNYFNDKNNNLKVLVSKKDYESNPFYGLNELPSFISPFSDEFLEEIIFLKSFVSNYLNQKIDLNKRESHWIYNGLEIFLIYKYIDDFYPNVKFLGRLSAISLIKGYEISKIDFNDLFLNYTEYVQRLNLHQIDDQSSELLTRINEEIASPYHSGVGLIYLEKMIGEDDERKGEEEIQELTNKHVGEIDQIVLAKEKELMIV